MRPMDAGGAELPTEGVEADHDASTAPGGASPIRGAEPADDLFVDALKSEMPPRSRRSTADNQGSMAHVAAGYVGNPQPRKKSSKKPGWPCWKEATERLPANYRIVLTMRDVEGLGSEDVRTMLGISEENQRVLLHRARTRPRSLLAPLLNTR